MPQFGERDGELEARLVTNVDGSHELEVALPRLGDPLRVFALCGSCRKPVDTGFRVARRDLPVRAGGQWRCRCGGVAVLPERLALRDAGTREQVVLLSASREEVSVSAISHAELLRLAQAARAVQEGSLGAEERLDRVLAEAPEPVRRLRDRMGPGEWIALAATIIAAVGLLTTILKDDGRVTERQLVDVIERLVDERSARGELGNSEQQQEEPTGPGNAGRDAGAAGPHGGGGDGRQ